MTDPRAAESFEREFAVRARAYTDVTLTRRIDALAVARAAMSSRRESRWSIQRLGAELRGPRAAAAVWATAFVAVVFVAVVGLAVQKRPPVAAGGPVPEALNHSWERPFPVAPGPDAFGSGFLRVTTTQLEVGRDPDSTGSKSAVAATDVDAIRVTATVDTTGCAIGDIGTYRWEVAGKGTALTLTPIGADACALRQAALAGPWVRSDLPVAPNPDATLAPGTYETSSFDPSGGSAAPMRLSYTVPEGWKVKEDGPAMFVLHHLPSSTGSGPSADTFVVLMARPAMAADFPPGAKCGSPADAPALAPSADSLVAEIVARPGVVSTPPVPVTIGDARGQVLDLELAASWTKGCRAPEGLIVGVPILQEAGSRTGAPVGLESGQRLRLIVLDMGAGRAMAIVIYAPGPTQPSLFEAHVSDAMRVIESFQVTTAP